MQLKAFLRDIYKLLLIKLNSLTIKALFTMQQAFNFFFELSCFSAPVYLNVGDVIMLSDTSLVETAKAAAVPVM